MNVSVGLMEGLPSLEVELLGTYVDLSGARLGPGRVRLDAETTLVPVDPASAAFAVDGVTIGIGFHWERKERQLFRGALRILQQPRVGQHVTRDAARSLLCVEQVLDPQQAR